MEFHPEVTDKSKTILRTTHDGPHGEKRIGLRGQLAGKIVEQTRLHIGTDINTGHDCMLRFCSNMVTQHWILGRRGIVSIESNTAEDGVVNKSLTIERELFFHMEIANPMQ